MTNIAPTIGPIVSGFVSPMGWRWTYWIGLIVAGLTLVLLLFLPETYGPVLLKHRARKLRKETGNDQIFAPSELEKRSLYEMLTLTLARPFHMIIFEPIVTFTCLYLSLVIALYCRWWSLLTPLRRVTAFVSDFTCRSTFPGLSTNIPRYLWYERWHLRASLSS